MLKKAFGLSKWFIVGGAFPLAMVGLDTVNAWQWLIHLSAAALIASLFVASISFGSDTPPKWTAGFYVLGALVAFTLANLNTDGRNIGLAFLAVWVVIALWRIAPTINARLKKSDDETFAEFLQGSSPSSK